MKVKFNEPFDMVDVVLFYENEQPWGGGITREISESDYLFCRMAQAVFEEAQKIIRNCPEVEE